MLFLNQSACCGSTFNCVEKFSRVSKIKGWILIIALLLLSNVVTANLTFPSLSSVSGVILIVEPSRRDD